MKKIALFILFILISKTANATVCRDYLSESYSKEYNKSVKITSKQEYIEKYEQVINKLFVSSIVSGYGYAKINNKNKTKILYICLLENDKKPIFGHILPHNQKTKNYLKF